MLMLFTVDHSLYADEAQALDWKVFNERRVRRHTSRDCERGEFSFAVMHDQLVEIRCSTIGKILIID